MFQHLSYSREVQAATAIVAATNISAGHITSTDGGALMAVFFTAGALGGGTMTVQAQGSNDGTTWFNLPADYGLITINVAGCAYIDFKRAVPPYVRFVCTPDAFWIAAAPTTSVTLRASDRP